MQTSSILDLVDLPAFLDYMCSFNVGCRQRLVASSLCGCLPLFPGDLLLTTGTFHSHFKHSTLAFSKLYDSRKILEEYPGVSDDISKDFSRLASELESVQSTEPSKKPNRTVVTFRQIENHSPQCGFHTQQATDNRSEQDSSGVSGLVVTANLLLEKLRATITDLKAEAARVSPEEQDSC